MKKRESNLAINLSAVVYLEHGTWIAHCLELDIVAEGATAEEAIDSLVSLCDLQITVALEEGDLAAVFKPAPPEVWKMFSGAKEKVVTEKRPRTRKRFRAPVQRFETRELQFA